ncbi:MAG: VOC family protein [Chloroflexota bacterium]|nr:VOC family protein [Dehalococcoidia bacterium]MDW8252511.1 VOC family protein [Chloroflexota bacterium]
MSSRTTLLGVHLAARDPERSRAFYTALGYQPLPGAPNTLALAWRPECRLVITPATSGDPAPDFLSRGVLAIDFYTRDLDEAIATLTARGATVWSGPVDYRFGAKPVRHAMLLGPDGERIGLMQVDRPAFATWRGDTLFSEPGLCPIGAPPEALTFYTDLLGWQVASDTSLDSVPMRQLTKLPDSVSIRLVLLDTGGPSQPRLELLIPDLPLPPTKPGRGFLGFDDGSGHAGLYDPHTGITYSIPQPRTAPAR